MHECNIIWEPWIWVCTASLLDYIVPIHTRMIFQLLMNTSGSWVEDDAHKCLMVG